MITNFLIFMLGACIGSFVNVVFTRNNWYKGRSRCDACGYILKWYDLVPVLSYVFLRGKCRKCGNKIGFEHLLAEIYMGCTFLCVSYIFEATDLPFTIIAGTGLIFLCLAAIQDFKEQMVFSWVLYGGMILLVIERLSIAILSSNWIGFAEVAVGVLLIKAFGYIICKKYPTSIGDGDFDLLSIMMLMFSVIDFVYALTISCIIGIIVYLPIIIIRKNRRMTIPFGPLLFIGSMTMLFIGG